MLHLHWYLSYRFLRIVGIRLGLTVAVQPWAWAAAIPVPANQSAPPFTTHIALPLVVTSPQPVNVTHHPAADFGPTWSPDGTRLAFISDRSGTPEVYVMLADGNEVSQLTDELFVPGYAEHLPWCVLDVAWSPVAAQLLFSLATCPPSQPGTHDPYATFIHLIDADGNNLQTLDYFGYTPVWAPDGKHFAYTVPNNAYWEPATFYLRIATIDSSDPASPLNLERATAPAWAPDSASLALIHAHAATVLLATINADGGDYAVRSSGEDRLPDLPQWSPDGSQIAYVVRETDATRLRVTNPISGTHATLTPIKWSRIVAPAWLPHRNQLVFWGRDFNATVPPGFYRFDLAEEKLELLLALDLPEEVDTMVWSPARTKVAFSQAHDLYVVRVPQD